VQSLEVEDREDEREPAGSEAQPGEPGRMEIAAPLPRRLALHAALAVLATPLPGGLLLGARWIAARRLGAGLLAVAAALAVTGLGVGIGLLAPFSVGPVAAAIYLIWLAAGLAAAWVEARAGLAPEVPWTREPRAGVQVLTWSAAVAVVGVLVAFGLATVTTRWGDEIFAKPSGSRQVLLMLLLVLVPAGALVGLARAALRRPARLATPVVFAASFYLVGLAVMAAEPLFKWLARGLSRTEELVVSDRLAGSGDVVLVLLAVGLYLLAALYLAEARRTLELIQRWAAVAALAFLFFWSFDVAVGDGPVSWRNRWATTAAGESRHADAARHWAWAVSRAPRDGVTAGLAVKGAREALLAGDPGLARTLLSRIDDGLLREHPAGLEAETARALLASRLDPGSLGGVRSVRIAPVFQEQSLDTGWSALLTAARAVRPELGEAEVKQKLQDLAGSVSSTDLPALRPLQQLRVVADLFGARAVAFPWSERDRVLAAGVPVLVQVPPSGRWILVFWSAPGADAVIALDYSLWGMGKKEDLDKDDVARLLVGGERPESRAARAQARVGVLRSASGLGALAARDGGMVFALVSPRQSGPALADLPADLTTLELARREMERRAFRRGLALAAQLPSGAARDELLAYAWFDPEGRKLLAAQERAAATVVGRLSRGIGSASPWLVEELATQTWGAREPFCALREPVLRAALALWPEESGHILELEKQAAAAGRSAEASDLALRSAALHGWTSAYLLEAMEPLALMPGAGADPAARAGLEQLLGRLAPLVESRSNAAEHTLRSAHPEYQAARAALSRDADDAAERWRRAVELKPRSAAYRLRLAEALERAGRTEEARQARQWAAAVAIDPACPGDGL
jgi:hypothetical protein